MKTTVCIPDPVFDEAEELAARLGVSRSELYARALADYVGERAERGVTARLDAVYANEPSELDPALARLQAASLAADDW